MIALCYDFAHRFSADGIEAMAFNGLAPSLVIGAPFIPIGGTKEPKPCDARTPRSICAEWNIPYEVCPHNIAIPMCQGRDLGIIVGARILKPKIIDAFRLGILNIHPGILPLNRGLGAVQRAIDNGWKQGATAHLIDESIDGGRIVALRTIEETQREKIDQAIYQLRLDLLIEGIQIVLGLPNKRDLKETKKTILGKLSLNNHRMETKDKLKEELNDKFH